MWWPRACGGSTLHQWQPVQFEIAARAMWQHPQPLVAHSSSSRTTVNESLDTDPASAK
jgi:hypothetical protein